MSKHMTIINLACTITKLRKWGEAWKHSAESAQAATARMHQAHEAKMVEHRAAFGARTEADAKIIAGLRAEVVDLKAQLQKLTSWAAKNQAARETLQNEIEKLKSQNPKQHPVKVGEWVRRTDAECDGIYFGRGVIAQVLDILDAPENQYTVSRPEWNGYTVPWAMQYCEPCDPPEATHDTEAGKAAAGAALKTEPVAEGDLVKVFQANGSMTDAEDIGSGGVVHKVDGFFVWLDRHYAMGLPREGIASLSDVRKVTT